MVVGSVLDGGRARQPLTQENARHSAVQPNMSGKITRAVNAICRLLEGKGDPLACRCPRLLRRLTGTAYGRLSVAARGKKGGFPLKLPHLPQNLLPG